MAKCDQGYLCAVCGEDVGEIVNSGLYLRFIIGEVESRQLFAEPEHHLRCNPVLAQFIVDPDFEAIVVENEMGKQNMDAQEVRKREKLITAGWQRLRQVKQLGIPVGEYPLAEVRERKKNK